MDDISVKPLIVLVPGAWHHVTQYAPIMTRLQQAGYEVHGIDYTSTGPNPTNLSFDPDVALIASTLRKLADEGKDIVVVVHSAAGIIAGEAAKDLGKMDREMKGRSGGVTRMVYIAAFANREGISLYDVTGGPPEWHIIQGRTVKAARPKEIFYNECPRDVAENNAMQLTLFAKGTFDSRPTYAPWKDIPSTYLICEKDQAIPLAAQEAMIEQDGAKFDVVRCASDHSPFLCMPDFTAKIIQEAAGEHSRLS